MLPFHHFLAGVTPARGAPASRQGRVSLLGIVVLIAMGAQTALAQAADHQAAATSDSTSGLFAALPEHTPLNPVVVARSGLYVQPILPPVAGWTVGVVAEYGSIVERNLSFPDSYLFDAELSRLRIQLRRDFSTRWFGVAEWGVAGAQAGFADRFFEGYHRLIQFTMEERDTRPRNSYGDRLFVGRHGIARVRGPHGPLPTDLRLSVGVRAGNPSSSAPDAVLSQTMLSLTLPAAPARSAYARGVATVSVLQTLRVSPAPRLALETAGGVGYSPRHGELSGIQGTTFVIGSGAGRLRLWGESAIYATVYGQRGMYHDSGFPELDRADLGVDFGYLWRTAGGRQWRVGLTEDVRRRDPGVDLALTVSTSR